jgi:lipoate-protein ligase A
LSQPFIFIEHHSKNPFFNLAAESYLLHEFDENIIFLYVNEPAVVVGKHQNAFEECQVEYCKENGIHVARRLSGGGTVFHGPGNLNFCFIKNGTDASKLIDFKRHLEPVIQFLHSIGIPAEYSGRNDILVDGYKISGNAEHVYSKKKRVIHHGTLLYDADLDSLRSSIAPKDHITFETHAVKSVRSKVKNITAFLIQPFDFKYFNDQLRRFLSAHYAANTYKLNTADLDAINALIDTKFGTWDWNLGYSPKFTSIVNLSDQDSLKLTVQKGIITSASSASQQDSITSLLIGKPFTKETFALTGFDVVI